MCMSDSTKCFYDNTCTVCQCVWIAVMCSSASSLTTFLSSVVVASLLSESNSFSVAKLYFWSSSAVASTKRYMFQSISETQAQIRNITATDRWSWISDATVTKPRNAIGSSNCQSNLIIPPASLVNEVRRAVWSISVCLQSEGKNKITVDWITTAFSLLEKHYIYKG